MHEHRFEELFRAGETKAMATLALEHYGGEIFGFLVTLLRSSEDASEVFADFCEDFWVGIPGFQWRSTLRTWMYALARHAAVRFRAAPHRKRVRNESLSAIGEVAEQVRTRTATFLRTEARDRFAALRDSLSMEDQALLTLRIDRKLEWREIARVLSEAKDIDEETATRDSARWRKRFQLLKDDLRRRGREPG